MLPGPGGMDPRQMAMMMRRMGIEMRDVQDVREVVVRTGDQEYVFSKPAVSVMKAQGQETWQVVGTPKAQARAASPSGAAASGSSGTSRGSDVSAVAGGSVGSGGSGAPAASQGRGLTGASGASSTSPGTAGPSGPAPPAASLAITEDDVRMVMETAKVGREEARKALLATDGDLAEAIVRLERK